MSIWGLLLLPFTGIYSFIIRLRNHLFNIEYSRSIEFEVPVICVGNLSVGGTGKSPMVEYLAGELTGSRNLAVLSRGYRRKTKGFRLTSESDSPETIGDEPYQIYRKMGDKIKVAVGEDRALSIPKILYHHEDTDLIILDDGFQHRSVKPTLSIVLTAFSGLFTKDYLLPTGRLREPRKEIKRADVVVVTKCPISMSSSKMLEIRSKIENYGVHPNSIYFTNVKYGKPVIASGEEQEYDKAYAIAGLASNAPFFEYCSSHFHLTGQSGFEDHHFYSNREVCKIMAEARRGGAEAIVTTEKDVAKIMNAIGPKSALPVFYLPIKIEFLENEARFLKHVKSAI